MLFNIPKLLRVGTRKSRTRRSQARSRALSVEALEVRTLLTVSFQF